MPQRCDRETPLEPPRRLYPPASAATTPGPRSGAAAAQRSGPVESGRAARAQTEPVSFHATILVLILPPVASICRKALGCLIAAALSYHTTNIFLASNEFCRSSCDSQCNTDPYVISNRMPE